MRREQSDFYKQYIRSDEWKAKREDRLLIDGYKCVMCGRPESKCRGGLQIHHISYERLGHENIYKDLCCLCGSCHQKIDNYYHRVRSPEDFENQSLEYMEFI